jgi:hypothetical protein
LNFFFRFENKLVIDELGCGNYLRKGYLFFSLYYQGIIISYGTLFSVISTVNENKNGEGKNGVTDLFIHTPFLLSVKVRRIVIFM